MPYAQWLHNYDIKVKLWGDIGKKYIYKWDTYPYLKVPYVLRWEGGLQAQYTTVWSRPRNWISVTRIPRSTSISKSWSRAVVAVVQSVPLEIFCHLLVKLDLLTTKMAFVFGFGCSKAVNHSKNDFWVFVSSILGFGLHLCRISCRFQKSPVLSFGASVSWTEGAFQFWDFVFDYSSSKNFG